MLPHDYSALNDAQCVHVDHFERRLPVWRERNLGDELSFRAARGDAQRRFPLEGEDVAQMDTYIATRFGVPKVTSESKGLPVPVMVVSE